MRLLQGLVQLSMWLRNLRGEYRVRHGLRALDSPPLTGFGSFQRFTIVIICSPPRVPYRWHESNDFACYLMLAIISCCNYKNGTCANRGFGIVNLAGQQELMRSNNH